MSQPGLSPLARGTRPQTEREEEITRFIPAGAGNTYEIRPLTVVCAVYPRWRGEHAAADVNGDMNNGLSPLARGTPGRCYCRSKPSRFIPAGAGNTSKSSSVARLLAVYPRWRGEHVRYHLIIRQLIGLSPLARGTRGHAPYQSSGYRFIPAGAGNTSTVRAWPSSTSVYPRWRGEHVGNGGRISIDQRFIPAGAGNTTASYCCLIPCSVYPRWRGEHLFLLLRNQQWAGLSPLARGTPR